MIRWDAVRARIDDFQRGMPFRLDPDRRAGALAAGEKQRLEILKQLFLGRTVLILDEPTSVLTPDEADQVLGVLRDMTAESRLSVVLITHKLREVEAFARDVTVLRGGRRVASGAVGALRRDDLVTAMIGDVVTAGPAPRAVRAPGPAALGLEGLSVRDDKDVRVAGAAYRPTRAVLRRARVRVLPEEPLASACVRRMTVAENLAFRTFDAPRHTVARWLVRRGALRVDARALIERFRIRTQGPDARLETLSGGNVQRTVLARELSGDPAVLIVQNPCAGLDLAATAETRGRIMAARNAGAAVLLVSEDLDELLELADRIVVMFEGALVHETPREAADLPTIGHFMASRGSPR